MEPLLDKILALVRAKQFPDIRSSFFGDPITYPNFDMPAIAVCPLRDDLGAYTMGARGKDKHRVGVRIYVIRNARDGFNQVTNESPVDRFLVRTAEEIVATLREELTLGGTVATFVTAGVQYAPAVRGREAVRMAQIDAIFEYYQSR